MLFGASCTTCAACFNVAQAIYYDFTNQVPTIWLQRALGLPSLSLSLASTKDRGEARSAAKLSGTGMHVATVNS